MANYCVTCGLPIPDGQNCCSMCYGDPEHGSDGYYQQWLEERWLEEQWLEEQAREEATQQLEAA